MEHIKLNLNNQSNNKLYIKFGGTLYLSFNVVGFDDVLQPIVTECFFPVSSKLLQSKQHNLFFQSNLLVQILVLFLYPQSAYLQ